MNLDEFRQTLTDDTPPAVAPLAQAMWWEAKGNWQRAHEIAQEIETPNGAWVHAYLHRKEGDDGNAGYWYRRADRPHRRTPFADEWAEIATVLLAG